MKDYELDELVLGVGGGSGKNCAFFSGTCVKRAFLRSFMFIKFINSTMRTLFCGLAAFLP
jgi:hypothetical protein